MGNGRRRSRGLWWRWDRIRMRTMTTIIHQRMQHVPFMFRKTTKPREAYILISIINMIINQDYSDQFTTPTHQLNLQETVYILAFERYGRVIRGRCIKQKEEDNNIKRNQFRDRWYYVTCKKSLYMEERRIWKLRFLWTILHSLFKDTPYRQQRPWTVWWYLFIIMSRLFTELRYS